LRPDNDTRPRWGTKAGFDPAFLALDTSGPHVSLALYSDFLIAEHEEPMARGQGEALIPMAERLLRSRGGTWNDLDYIAVGVGPGNFTGIRIAVSAARGVALGLGIPAVGVTTFETLLDWDGPLSEPQLILSVQAPRDQAYVQVFRYGVAQSPPQMIDPAAPPAHLERPMNMVVKGFRAKEIAAPFGAKWDDVAPDRYGARVGHLAHLKVTQKIWDGTRPAPLYVKAPDAAPSREKPPVILP